MTLSTDQKLGLGIVAVVFAAIAYAGMSQGSQPKGEEWKPAVTQASDPKPTTVPVEVVSIKPVIGGFGSVSLVSLKLKNPNDFDVKDTLVKCSNLGESGTIISANERVVYRRIRAHGTITANRVNFGLVSSQATSTSCVAELSVGPV